MPSFGTQSIQKLSTCHPDLVRLFEEVVKHVDCVVLEGRRGKAAQDEAFHKGMSKLPWPQGNHNCPIEIPGMAKEEWPEDPGAFCRAVDVAPYPVNWNNKRRFDHFAGIVRGIAMQMGLKIRWGGDWNMNFDPSDETFLDLPHYELLSDK